MPVPLHAMHVLILSTRGGFGGGQPDTGRQSAIDRSSCPIDRIYFSFVTSGRQRTDSSRHGEWYPSIDWTEEYDEAGWMDG